MFAHVVFGVFEFGGGFRADEGRFGLVVPAEVVEVIVDCFFLGRVGGTLRASSCSLRWTLRAVRSSSCFLLRVSSSLC
jgi:hypothetical protein